MADNKVITVSELHLIYKNGMTYFIHDPLFILISIYDAVSLCLSKAHVIVSILQIVSGIWTSLTWQILV